ncbi:MAG: thioredoxin family protein [Mucinivorans sp.]
MRTLLIILALLASSISMGFSQGVQFFDGGVMDALSAARSAGKLLLVEFYAPWNYSSEWMHNKVLGDKNVAGSLEDSFIVVSVNTTTQEGAALAVQYSVTNYPYILFFNSAGQVVGVGDKALDPGDFLELVEQTLFASDGSTAWRFEQIMQAAGNGDVKRADELFTQYADSFLPHRLINRTHWPLMVNSMLTRYGSPSYRFLMDHASEYGRVVGVDKLSERMESLFFSALLPYISDTTTLDSLERKAIFQDIDSFDFKGLDSVRVSGFVRLANLRACGDITEFITTLTYLYPYLSSDKGMALALSLNFVVKQGSTMQKVSAKRFLEEQVLSRAPTSQSSILSSLIGLLSGKE